MGQSITVVKDIRPGERRVLLQPREITKIRDGGFEVCVESGAGDNAGISDETFARAGATILDRDAAWSQPFVVKYKAPEPEEFDLFHENLTLGAYLHAEDEDELVSAMCRAGMTAYSFEYFESKDGLLPMATADDEIAGKLSIF